MKEILRTDLTLRGVLIAIAAVAPTVFPASLAGFGTLHDLAFSAILPAAMLLALPSHS
jgi:uncharacterized membrane protein